MTELTERLPMIHTVLGPVPRDQVGVIAPHEALLSVLPGAQYAFDITIDRAAILEALAEHLTDFKEAGGGAVVDATGMFHGRDLPLLEAVSRHTGVHVIASTGLGPEEMLGGYFLTPQTNPPTPWAAERFAALFGREVTDGMVVPRRERRAAAGLIVTASSEHGITPTEISLFRGAAQAAMATGTAVLLATGTDPLAQADHALGEGIEPERLVLAGADRRSWVTDGTTMRAARRGHYVLLGAVGLNDDPSHLDDGERVGLVRELLAVGLADRVLLSPGAVLVGKGVPSVDRPLTGVLTDFVPRLRAAGVPDADIDTIIVTNPADLLTVHAAVPGPEVTDA